MNNLDQQQQQRIAHRRISVLKSTMNYLQAGEGDPVVFLHGNPTSSFLWRNIIPFVQEHARCYAPDLIGMGKSGKSESGHYGFMEQVKYLDEWFEQLKLKAKVTLVLHDWGSALGFYWAYRNQEKVKAIIFMEAIVQPRLWSDFPDGRDKLFRMLRSKAGEEMVYGQNFFVETVLPKSVIRPLTAEELQVYREPFSEKESRRPTLELARDLPIEGEPADVSTIVETYGEWLSKSNVPKLMIVAEPGALLHGRNLAFARTWPNQQEVTVKGIHYIQEDSPDEIGQAIALFYRSLDIE